MTVTSIVAATLTLRIGEATPGDGTSVECQVVSVGVTRPRAGDATIVRTACPPDGGAVAEPGEPEPGQLTANVVVDHSTATAVCRWLNEHHEETADYALTLDPATPHERTYAGQLVVRAAVEAWEAGKLQRADLDLPLITATVTYPAP